MQFPMFDHGGFSDSGIEKGAHFPELWSVYIEFLIRACLCVQEEGVRDAGDARAELKIMVCLFSFTVFLLE